MLLLVLALVWVAILLPVLVRYWRDRGGERKIESYHTERERLIRQEQEHAVFDPRHESPSEPLERERPGRPHLTVVYPEDTVRSLKERGSWDEWRRDYEYDLEDNRDAVRARLEHNRYAAAYSSVPNEVFDTGFDEPYGTQVSMQLRRRRILVGLVLTCLAFTLLTLVSSSAFLANLAVLAWALLIGFVDLGLVAIGLGYMESPLDTVTRTNVEVERPSQPAYESDVEYLDEEYFDEDDQRVWRHETAPRRALG